VLSTVPDLDHFEEPRAEPKIRTDLGVKMIDTDDPSDSETDCFELECCLEDQLEDHTDHLES
jgi:hypothetical protein